MNLYSAKSIFLSNVKEGKMQDSSKITYQRKLDVFFEYLEIEFDIDYNTDIEKVISFLDAKTIINSIYYYVKVYDVNGIATINCYKSVLNSFFDFLNEEVVNNKFFDSKLSRNELHEMIECKITEMNLKNKDDFYPITESTFYELSKVCDYYINSFIISDENIRRITETSEVKRQVDDFDKFVSSIAIKLVMLMGIGNSIVQSINIDQLNLDSNFIRINKYNIYLPHKLNEALNKYQKMRSKILDANNRQEENALFVDRKGNRAVHNTFLFKVLHDVLDNYQVKTVSKYTIINLLKKNTSSIQIENLTGYKETTIEHCRELLLEANGHRDLSLTIRSLKEFEVI